MTASTREVLLRCKLLRSVTAACLEGLVGLGQVRCFEAGERIFAQGDEAAGLYVVDRGAVRVFKLAPGGKEHVLHFAGAGDTFAEAAVLGDFPCPAHAEATEPTRCVLLPQEALRARLASDPDLPRQMLAGMALWVRQLVGLLEDVVLRDAEGRTARYLVDAAREGTVLLPALKRHLASHLNLTSETFSRTLSRLGERGLIAREGGGRIRVLDPTGLRSVAHSA